MTQARRSPTPRLVLRFAAASLAAFLLIGIVLATLIVRSVRGEAEANAGFHAGFVALSVLTPALDGIDLSRPISGGDLSMLDRLIRRRVLSDGRTVRVKVWAPDGTIVYSDEHDLIGRTFPEERSDLTEVLDGHVENGVSDLSAGENVDERGLADKLFQSYVPLRQRAGAAPVAVAELYQDYSTIQVHIDKLVRTLTVIFGVGLAVLYALLLPIALGAGRTLREQNFRLREQAQRLETLLAGEQDAVAELRRLNQMQSDFVAAASHELRTPLTSVIGYLRTLRQPGLLDDPDAVQEFLGSAELQATRLSRLVQNLLAAASVEDGGRPVQVSPFGLGELIERILGELPGRRDRVHVHLGEVHEVKTDRDRLHEVLLNLMDNALKYSPDAAPVDVEASTEGDALRIDVRDHGIGIDAADQPAIFDRFHQLDQSTTRRYGGLGLGLHLAKELMDDLGGAIAVESAPGRGSTFTIRLPGAVAGVVVDPADRERAAG